MTDDSLQRVTDEMRETVSKIYGQYVILDQITEWADRLTALQSAQTEGRDAARPIDEYHEDMGPVAWWKFPIVEASYIGSPNFDDWPGYHTHFTPHPAIPSNHAAIDNAQATEGK